MRELTRWSANTVGAGLDDETAAAGGEPKQALEIFKLNVHLIQTAPTFTTASPRRTTRNGFRELAIKNYKRSLELDPKNSNAMHQLKRFESK